MRNMKKAKLAAISSVLLFIAAAIAPVRASAVGLAISPSSLSFDRVALGTTSAPQTVTITNQSGAPAGISGIAVSAGFTVINDKCSGNQLAANASCTAGVTFTASQPGGVRGELSISTGGGAAGRAGTDARAENRGREGGAGRPFN